MSVNKIGERVPIRAIWGKAAFQVEGVVDDIIDNRLLDSIMSVLWPIEMLVKTKLELRD